MGVSPASADRASYHATVNGDVAFTDNVFSEQRGQQDGDLFTQIRPGVRFTYGMPRMIHDIEAEAEITQYALHRNTPSFTGRVGWQSLFLPGPRSELTIAAGATNGVLNAISARTTPDQTVIQLTPLGKMNFRSADGSQYASYILSREMRVSQRLFARASETDDNLMEPTIVTSAEAGAAIAFERSFRKSSISFEAGTSVVRMERVAPVGAMQGSRLDRQWNPRGRVAYTYDIDRRFSWSADAGAVYVMPYGNDPYNPGDDTRRNGLFPIIGGQVSVVDGWGVGTMSLRRDVTPNLFIAQNTVSEMATITGGFPIKWREDNRRRAPKVALLGAIAAMRTRLIDPMTSDTGGSFGLGRIDVGLRYLVRPGWSYSVRYELMFQTPGRDTNGQEVAGFFRNTFYFTFNVRWPEDLAVQVPKRNRNSVRSDRKDMMPLGAEPVIPDLQEQGGDSW